MKAPKELVDNVLVGGYRLDALLGSGGMGAVYRAHPVEGGDDVAIKILLKQHVGDQALVARFEREARAARVVDHPNVVRVLDIGRDAEGTPFIVQELLRGEDLSKLLKVSRKISPALALELMIPVVEAMAHAHARGVVHRDLKPGNIFITFVDGKRTPKVLDFGVSHLIDDQDGTRLTSTGVSLGTPAYMAPEQVMASKTVDARADVWSLGVILFQLVAGRLPFPKAESAGALYVKICTTEAPPLEKIVSAVPRDYARVVTCCLRPERGDRYPSAAELLDDLRSVRDDRPVGPLARGVRTAMDGPLGEDSEPEPRGSASMPSDMPTQSLSTGEVPRRPQLAPSERSIPPPALGSGTVDVVMGLLGCASLVLVPWHEGAAALGPSPDLPRLVVLAVAVTLGVAAAVRGVLRGRLSRGHVVASIGFLALALSAGVEAFAAVDFPSLPGRVAPWAMLTAAAGYASVGVGEVREAFGRRPPSRTLATGAVLLALASLAAAALIAWHTAAALGVLGATDRST